MAPSRSATSITWSLWTNRNSASLSTNFLMSQGQATRSTLTCSRVIHFIEIFSFSLLRQGSNARDSSSPPARSSPVILSAAKDLCARRARPFAEFPLSEANGLRVTRGDCSNGQVLFFTLNLALEHYLNEQQVNMLSSSSSLLTARLAGELRIQCIVDEPPPFQRDLVVGAYQAQAPANQIQASSRGLQADLLHGIGLIDHAGDVLQDGIVQIVLAQHGVKRAVPPAVGEPHAGDIKRPCPFRQRFVPGRNEQEFGCWIKISRDEPGAGHAVHAHLLPGDPFHEANPPLALIRRARTSWPSSEWK